MKNYYYLIWADAILSFKKFNPKRKDWISTLLFYLSFVQSINIWIIYVWLKYFKVIDMSEIDFHVLSIPIFNNAYSYFIIFLFPMLIINYFFVFYNNRYKKIIEKYTMSKTRYAPIYSFSVAIFALITLFLLSLLN